MSELFTNFVRGTFFLRKGIILIALYELPLSEKVLGHHSFVMIDKESLTIPTLTNTNCGLSHDRQPTVDYPSILLTFKANIDSAFVDAR